VNRTVSVGSNSYINGLHSMYTYVHRSQRRHEFRRPNWFMALAPADGMEGVGSLAWYRHQRGPQLGIGVGAVLGLVSASARSSGWYRRQRWSACGLGSFSTGKAVGRASVPTASGTRPAAAAAWTLRTD
jgi:hypothetical protein